MSAYLRVLNCCFNQPTAPPSFHDLSSLTIAITGPTPGSIGASVAHYVSSFNARVILLARTASTAQQTVSSILSSNPSASISIVPCDLSNLSSVRACAEQLANENVDVLVANAGAQFPQFQQNEDGVEMSFAVCALGHHLLIELCKNVRVVWTTGDIYALSDGNVSPWSKRAGIRAYQDACLGRLWLTAEWKKRGRMIEAVHPGVVSSGLMKTQGMSKWIMQKMLLSSKHGATAIVNVICRGDDRRSVRVPYFHNKHGWMNLKETDLAMDEEKARGLFKDCDEACGIKRE